MQFNTGYSESLERLIQHLPAAVSELSKNRSPFEAFEAGYVNGRKSVNMQVEDALLELPMSLNKDKKSCEEAYLKGVEIGQKVKSSIDYAKACLKGSISLPKIRKYQGMDRTPKYYIKLMISLSSLLVKVQSPIMILLLVIGNSTQLNLNGLSRGNLSIYIGL